VGITKKVCHFNVLGDSVSTQYKAAVVPASDYVFVVNDKNIGVSVTEKNGSEQFIEKTTFSMSLSKHIDSGDESGFLCSVYCSLRDEERSV
jgi:hypothetical protein